MTTGTVKATDMPPKINTSWTKDFKPPGILWVVLIAAGIVYAENYVDSRSIARVIELTVVLGPILAKLLYMGDKEVNALLDTIAILQSKIPFITRSARTAEAGTIEVQETVPFVPVEEARPRKWLRALVG